MIEQAKATSTWRVLGLDLALDEPDSVLRERALERAGVPPEDLRGLRIAHKALDARRRGAGRAAHFVVHVDLLLEDGYESTGSEHFRSALQAGRILPRSRPGRLELEQRHASLAGRRAVVVGAGPAGLFAALTLARNGVAVEVLDRGPSLAERSRSLGRFLHTRELDPESNLLFGEGGAGTYSDGKIYTRVDHPLEAPLIEELIACGAPPEIAYDARAHIGTDRLHRILPRLRARMEDCGVRFHWRTRLEGLVCDGAAPRFVRALATSQGEIACDAVFLALGHSARDTVRQLCEQGLEIEARPFQLGVRIEHPQALIDAGRYGDRALAQRLGPAYYGLRSTAGGGAPRAHSFCMCPGGKIVAAVNSAGLLCTNGMSNSRHSSPWASAAIVTTLGPREFGDGPLAGVRLQQQLESRFFEVGGGDYTAPAQRAPDFLAGRETRETGPSSYQFGTRPARIDALLPPDVRDGLRRALGRFDRQIPGYAGPDGLLVGIESRSSSPLRVPRDDVSRRARHFANVFPIGEGAGYAGGITSAAIDGARSAQALLQLGLAGC